MSDGEEDGADDGRGRDRGEESEREADREQGRGDGAAQRSTVEKAITAVSLAFTVALFGFVVWQALTTPLHVAPQADVIDTTTLADGDVRVMVELRNPSGAGLEVAVVAVECTDPPIEITFEHVPADGRRTAVGRCPPGSNVSVAVESWIEA